MRIQTTLAVVAIGCSLAACTTSQKTREYVKSAESARFDHFKTNVHAQKTLAEKQHAERASLSNKQARERQEASEKTMTDLKSDNAKVDSTVATIAKEHRAFLVETREELGRIDARASALLAHSRLEPPSIQRKLHPMWNSYYADRVDMSRRIAALPYTSEGRYASSTSAITAHLRAEQKTLDAIADTMK